MWSAITDLLHNAAKGTLSPEAVIEILIGLLGVMIAVLALIAALVTIIFAILAIFGFDTIRKEVRNIAEKIAGDTATNVATEIASKTSDRILRTAQAGGLSESQAQEIIEPVQGEVADEQEPIQATTDQGLTNSGDHQ